MRALAGGWRKKVYLVEKRGEKRIFCLIPKEAIKRRRLLAAIRLEEELTRKGVIRGRKLIEFGEDENHWKLILTYLPGKLKWQWTKKESFEIGQILARLHQAGVAHLDLKPGNILWDKRDNIVGVIDFEEAKLGKRWFLKDLANTLSWILVSGGSAEEFWRGYGAAKARLDYGRIESYLDQFLHLRMRQGSPKAFLVLAQRQLQQYRRQIKTKLLTPKDLSSFRRKYRDKKIVLSVGGFELLHWGHLQFLKRARARGDLLVVAVASDFSRRKAKGPLFPLVGEKTRAETIAHFPFVDGVVIASELDLRPIIKKLKPNLFYTARQDWENKVRRPEEAALVEQLGGKVIKAKHFQPALSSEEMIERVALFKIRQVLFGVRSQRPLLSRFRIRHPRVISFSELASWAEKIRRQKKTIVFTSGSFDLFHLGHARFLQKARSCGQVLVVGVPSNQSMTQTKGLGRPIVDQWARAAVVAELAWVDQVVIFPQRTILELLKVLKPEVFFTVKESWNRLTSSPEAKLVRDYGGKIVRSERQGPGISASKMIDKAAGELIRIRFAPLMKLAEENPVLNADFDPYALESQLGARHRGFYQQVLIEVAKKKQCVFCDLKEKYIIAERGGVVLTVALFPYIDGHLLIIPRRHCQSLTELKVREWQAVKYLTQLGLKLLKKELGQENVWFLEREGSRAGKTVSHLHFHLIPFVPELVNWHYQRITLAPQKLAEKLRQKRKSS